MKDKKTRDLRVSVIIPVYNDVAGIRKCLKSLKNPNFNKTL